MSKTSLDCDVLIVGGGINGAGIARDLAGRGWRVLLAEQHDLAAHTSSASTKLIHGGLRYLEHGEFGLVRKALLEREVLLKSAPHIMAPLRFVMPLMPHQAALRPAWVIRLGLFLYDHLARREVLPGSAGIDLRNHPAGRPLQPRFTRGFVYSDGWVDDARLVVLSAIDARDRGATVLTRTRCVQAQRGATHWQATLRGADGTEQTATARALVNAAGPWAASFLHRVAQRDSGEPLATHHLRLVRGSHIVVPCRAPQDWPQGHAYIFQNADGRIIFAIPYQGRFTLIGTTDVELETQEPGDAVQASDAEVAYLCEQANHYLREPVTPADVVWRYAGVRPLLDDHEGNPAAVTRDYRLEAHPGGAPLLTVWGGKITTFRKLAEEASDTLGRLLKDMSRPAWTHAAYLPGGDLSAWIGAPTRPDADFERFVTAVCRRYPQLDAALARRLAQAYGSRIDRVLLGDGSPGAEVAPGLFEAELNYLRREEWACDADDVLWRRTKLGLLLDDGQRQGVARRMG